MINNMNITLSYQTEDFLKELMKSNIEIIDRLKENRKWLCFKRKERFRQYRGF